VRGHLVGFSFYNKLSSDDEYPLPPLRVCMTFAHEVCHAPISVVCLFSDPQALQGSGVIQNKHSIMNRVQASV